jgi:hypothetical protein
MFEVLALATCRNLASPVMRKLAAALAVQAASVMMLLAPPMTQGASAAVSCVSVGPSFSNALLPGQCITSPNRLYTLVMQGDGNLVLYRSSGGKACWASSWGGGGFRAGDRAIFTTIGVPIFNTGDTEYGLAVGHYTWGPFFSATWRWDNGDFHLGNRNYNVNVNDRGQFWVAYDFLGSC